MVGCELFHAWAVPLVRCPGETGREMDTGLGRL